MQYRLVATSEFSLNWFHQGVHRDALRLAPAIIFNEKDQLHTQFIQHEFGLNLAQYPHFFIPSTHAFFDAIVMGLGYGWLPDYQTRDLLESGRLLELSSEMRIEVPLYWHHWKEQSPALEILGECLKQHAQTAMNQPIAS
jgi:LysR family transcriptional regulator (chromosome initiation inhibitor)